MTAARATLASTFALVAACAVAGCRPDFGAPLSRVSAPRIEAVRFDPAEAQPGTSVTATAFVVTPDGATTPPVDWSLCLTPKSTTNNDVVDPTCLQPSGTMAIATSDAPEAVTLPSDACRLFGPDTPPQTPGQPPVQSRAPDVTGGYYQPVRAELDGATPTIGLARIRCSLAGASFMLAAEYDAEYVDNTNPTLTPLSAFVGGNPVALDAIPAGAAVTLAAGWTADSPEQFPVLDPVAQQLVMHREAMTLSWLASDGVVAEANTGVAEADPTLFTTTTWTAPTTPGVVHLFLVLHDSRGGIAFAAYDATVQ